MRNIITTQTVLCLMLMTLASCSQDGGDEAAPQREALMFTATIKGAESTRASADGTFRADDRIAVNALGRDMVFGRDDEDGAWTHRKNVSQGDQDGTPLWTDSKDIAVRAWYFHDNNGGGAYEAFPSGGFGRRVAADQSSDEGYYAGDFLYAEGALRRGGRNTLEFSHRVSKVTVHVLCGDKTPADIAGGGSGLTGLTIGGTGSEVALAGLMSPDGKAWTPLGGETGAITPRPLGSKTVTANGAETKSIASYEALVIPQSLKEGGVVFAIKFDGHDAFSYKAPSGGLEWAPGREQVYLITIQGDSGLSVTVSGRMGWSAGASGSGSATLITESVKIGSLYWATGNLVSDGKQGAKIGAPTDCGLYFRFGSLVGVAGGANGDGTGAVKVYSPSNTTWVAYPSGYDKTIDIWNAESPAFFTRDNIYIDPKEWTVTRYTNNQGVCVIDVGDGISVGDPCKYYLGGDWRLPKMEDFQNLLGIGDGDFTAYTNNWKWQNAPNPVGMNYNNAGINLFIPVSGFLYGAENKGIGYTWRVNFWSSIWHVPGAWPLIGDDDEVKASSSITPYYDRIDGLPVRCVRSE